MPASCLPAQPAPKARGNPEGLGEPARFIPVQGTEEAALAGAACWVNIVLFFSFFLFKQALLSPDRITLNKASQCC